MKMIDNVLFQRALVNFQRHPICGDERTPFYAEPKYCPDIKEQVLFLCRLILTLMIQTFKDHQYITNAEEWKWLSKQTPIQNPQKSATQNKKTFIWSLTIYNLILNPATM